MNSKSNLTTGILIGVGLSVAAWYLYMNNKSQVDEFLRSQGIAIPETIQAKDYSKMNMEELVSTKEHIEDLIAELEHKSKEQKS